MKDDNVCLAKYLVTSSGVTIYLNKKSVITLHKSLEKMILADEDECHEVHLNLLYSRFSEDNKPVYPKAEFENEIGKLIDRLNIESFNEFRKGEDFDELAEMFPFDINIMQIKSSSIEE